MLAVAVDTPIISRLSLPVYIEHAYSALFDHHLQGSPPTCPPFAPIDPTHALARLGANHAGAG
jgi:nanoRNase/pAp phosphatase (c-di-AMP/oligoRNAs hydrolase)